MTAFTYRDKTALITGGSSGIGFEFACQLAEKGARLVLVARHPENLHAATRQLRQRYNVTVMEIALDLTGDNACRELSDKLAFAGISPDILVNSAGFATYGRFSKLALPREQQQITLNCQVPVALTHTLLPAMLERGQGAVINIASTAAFQPVPYMATYGATKAFLLSFSEALWAEYRTRGIRVLALCPGPTATPFFQTVNAKEAMVGKPVSPVFVVRQALRSLERQHSYRVTGWRNWLLSQLPAIVTRKRITLIAEKIMKPATPELPG